MGGLGVSVIEESGLYSWAIAAHELGHRYVHQWKCLWIICVTRSDIFQQAYKIRVIS